MTFIHSTLIRTFTVPNTCFELCFVVIKIIISLAMYIKLGANGPTFRPTFHPTFRPTCWIVSGHNYVAHPTFPATQKHSLFFSNMACKRKVVNVLMVLKLIDSDDSDDENTRLA